MNSEQKDYDDMDQMSRQLFGLEAPQDQEMKSEVPMKQDPGLNYEISSKSNLTEKCQNLQKIEKVVKKREIKSMIKYRSSVDPSHVYQMAVDQGQKFDKAESQVISSFYSPTKMDDVQAQPPKLELKSIPELRPTQSQHGPELRPFHFQPMPVLMPIIQMNPVPELRPAQIQPVPELRPAQIQPVHELRQPQVKLVQKISPPQIHQKFEEKLEKADLFEQADIFRAGTFKFDKNPHYCEDIQEFEVLQMKKINLTQNRMSELNQIIYIDRMKTELKPHIKYFKTFVPIFPFLYNNLDQGSFIGNRKLLQLSGSQKIHNKELNTEETVHRRVQIKFSVIDNCLLKYEETRASQLQLQHEKQRKFADYLMELDFSNIKTVWIYKDQNQIPMKPYNKYQNNSYYGNNGYQEEEKHQSKRYCNLEILIQLRRPCAALKFGPSKDFAVESNAVAGTKVESPKNDPNSDRGPPSMVRSPFNMTSNLKSDIGQFSKRAKDDVQMVNYETLLNYWNNNQVIQMGGTATKVTLETFIQTLKKLNPKAKVIQSTNSIDELGINFLDKQELKRELANVRDKGLRFADQINQMRPSLRFSILALLSSNKFNIFNKGLIDFMEMLNNGGWNNNDVTADFGAFIIDHINLFKELDYKDDSSKQIEDLFRTLHTDQIIVDDFKRVQQNKDSIRQRRVLVTPSLFHYTVAREEESNKVIRQFKDNLTQFIRLSFVKEDYDQGFYCHESSRYLLGYIHSILKNGFYAGRGLKNNFLSYSNSQLKNHTSWFLSQITDGVDEKKIIQSMGNFEKEKNILKRYARRGQCFSTTKMFQTISKDEVNLCYPDIERDGYVFSDGCGLIRPDIAQEIAAKYKLSNVSGFQIRLGGAKGVLAVCNDPNVFKGPTKDYKILLRNSQVKFESDNLTLDIVRCATFSQGFLNRQIILLLHCLGVPIDFFLEKQKIAKQYCCLTSIQKRISDKIERIHTKFGNILQNQQENFSLDFTVMKNKRLKDLARDMKLSVEPCKTFQATLKQALIKGMDIMSDPIFSSILYSMQLNQFMNLKKKARILLPDSCVLIGIIDPTGLLEENEIFVQIRKDSFSMHKHGQGIKNRKNRMEQAEIISSIDSMAEIIEGDVLITRNPCTHPGDIRMLNCVDKHELRYLFNVVVFSSKGARPQCNMMSGGDLDGDVYFVTWDKELISYIKPEDIKEPADYSKNELIKEKPDSDDLADYFVFYLQRDVLGTVSNLWLTLSDHYGQHGPMTEDCISLSHMCSVAVDFAKHGECVSKQNYKRMQEIIKILPDFLEKEHKPSFESNGVLGHVYRDIKSDEALDEFIGNDWKHSINLNYKLDQNILDLVQDKSLMHRYLVPCFEQIVQPMSLYFKKIMIYFNLAQEGELFACDLKHRLCHQVNEKTFYAGDPGTKTEDTIQNLNTMKRQILSKFQGTLNEIINTGTRFGDKNSRVNVAVALYLATYFDSNESGIEYLQKHRQEPFFSRFFTAWNKASEGNEVVDSFVKKIKNDQDAYHTICSEAEQGDQRKIRKLLKSKKLFCIPWVLAGDIILVNYPDKFDSEEYREMIRKKQEAREVRERQQVVKVATNSGVEQPTKDQLNKLSRAQKLGRMFGNFGKENLEPQQENQEFIPLIKVQEDQEMKPDQQAHPELPSFLGILNDVFSQMIEMKIEDQQLQP